MGGNILHDCFKLYILFVWEYIMLRAVYAWTQLCIYIYIYNVVDCIFGKTFAWFFSHYITFIFGEFIMARATYVLTQFLYDICNIVEYVVWRCFSWLFLVTHSFLWEFVTPTYDLTQLFVCVQLYSDFLTGICAHRGVRIYCMSGVIHVPYYSFYQRFLLWGWRKLNFINWQSFQNVYVLLLVISLRNQTVDDDLALAVIFPCKTIAQLLIIQTMA